MLKLLKETRLIEGYNIFAVNAVRSVLASNFYAIALWRYYSKTKNIIYAH